MKIPFVSQAPSGMSLVTTTPLIAAVTKSEFRGQWHTAQQQLRVARVYHTQVIDTLPPKFVHNILLSEG